MAYYISATARVVDVNSGNVINKGATIKCGTNSITQSQILNIGSATRFSISSYYQYWKAELKSGYTFDHWNVTTSDPAPGGRQDPPASKDFYSNPTGQWSFLAVARKHQTSSSPLPYTVTLYVKAPPATKTVTLNPNEGSVSPNTIQCTVGGVYGEIPTPVREGWDFVGWFDDQTHGNQINSDTPFTDTSPTTLWAHWSSSPIPPRPHRKDSEKGYLVYSLKSNSLSFSIASGSIVYAI